MGLTGVIASFAIEILSEAQTAETCVTGANRLLAQPEYQDPAKAHALMSYINDAQHIKHPARTSTATAARASRCS